MFSSVFIIFECAYFSGVCSFFMHCLNSNHIKLMFCVLLQCIGWNSQLTDHTKFLEMF